MDKSYTSIRVTDELADELYDRKERGESYEDVIWRLLDDTDEDEDEQDTRARTDDEIGRAIELGSKSWEDKPDKLEDRRAAARAVLEAIREEPRKKNELLELRDQYPVEGQGERSWWRLNLKSEKADHPGPLDYVATLNRSTNKYEWTGIDEDAE